MAKADWDKAFDALEYAHDISEQASNQPAGKRKLRKALDVLRKIREALKAAPILVGNDKKHAISAINSLIRSAGPVLRTRNEVKVRAFFRDEYQEILQTIHIIGNMAAIRSRGVSSERLRRNILHTLLFFDAFIGFLVES